MDIATESLAGGEVHIWIADLDAEPAPADALAAELLSADERRRAARFADRRKGVRWARSHALLRAILGGYLQAEDPARLRFVIGAHGKPRLDGERAWLRFNLSHSGAVALYAVAAELEVGVDVQCSARPASLALAGRAFGPAARAQLGRLDEGEREADFLRLWTRGEARAKCGGAGLWGGGKGAAGAPRRWTADVQLGGGAAAALACSRPPQAVRTRRVTLAVLVAAGNDSTKATYVAGRGA